MQRRVAVEEALRPRRRETEEVIRRFTEELRRRGLRVTPQRLLVATVVYDLMGRHPSFTEIVDECRRRMPGISTSTVYSTLQLMEELGFLVSFNARGETRYDKVDPHVNIVCLDTGEIRDVEIRDAFEAVEKTGVKPKAMVVYAYCGSGGAA